MGRTVLTASDVRKYSVPRAAEDATPAGVLADAPPRAPQTGKNSGAEADGYQERLVKYIPADVIALYLAIEGVLKTAGAQVPVGAIRWVVFILLLPATWLYLSRVARISKRQQIQISVVSFAVWVFSLGGPFTELRWYDPIYGAIILPLYTFIVPIFEAQR